MSRVSEGASVSLSDALAALARRRPVFHSEADFQHELAMQIRHDMLAPTVRLEISLSPGITLDMLVSSQVSTERFAIELKYKTAAWQGIVSDEIFRLKSHGANDIGSYDVLKDVERVESLVRSGNANRGAVVFLTNEPVYWNPRGDRGRVTNAHAFRLGDDAEPISGVRAWGPNTGGTSKGREAPITLRGTYHVKWSTYSSLPGDRGEFRYLLLEVGDAESLDSPLNVGG